MNAVKRIRTETVETANFKVKVEVLIPRRKKFRVKLKLIHQLMLAGKLVRLK